MKILVCVKDLDGCDLNALTAALEISGDVTALTAGPDRAYMTVCEALARGASKGILVSDRAAKGSDTLATARVLAKAVERSGGDFDIILLGRESGDAATGQVGPMLAELLDLRQITNVTAIDGNTAVKIEDGREMELTFSYPVLMTISPDINETGPYEMSGIYEGRRPVVWDCDDIRVDRDLVGEAGSPTRIINTEKVRKDGGGEWIEGDPAAEKAEELITRLRIEWII